MGLKEQVEAYVTGADDPVAALNEVRGWLHFVSPFRDQPVDYVKWVPAEQITPNDYNPNSVARAEMQLLATSILHDGFTQPVVSVCHPETRVFEIVDGFHRYYTGKTNAEIRARVKGYLPVVEIVKDINDRMASTIRHNRARGKHAVQGMSSMVFAMLEQGWSDEEICNELGMDPEELLRLKHITGFSKLFEDVAYRRSWMTERQIRIQAQYCKEHPEEAAS